MSPEDLLLIKSKLPKGYRDSIKDATGYSLTFIDKVMTGEKYNQVIVDASLNILEVTQAARKNAKDKFNRLLNEPE